MRPMGRKWIVGSAVAVLGVVAVVVVFLGDGASPGPLEASGTVEATEAHLGFQAAGRIHRLRVEEGDPVRRGDTLAVLDRREMLARRDGIRAEIEAARATLRELESGFRVEEVRQAEAARDAAAEQLEDARRDLGRTRRLHEGDAVSQEALDKARTAYEVARSEHRRAQEQLELLRSGPRPEKIEAQRARLQGARARLRAVEAGLENMVVTAPFPGVVTVRHSEPGETVSPGSAVLTVMNPGDRWVRIYVREDRIGAVKLGQPASITTDSYPQREYEGRVRFIASEAEFTPKNVQTTEERVKLVYAVKVQITGDLEQDLKPGIPADVAIDTGGG